MKFLFTLFLALGSLSFLQAQLFFGTGNTGADAGRAVTRNTVGETFVAATISGGNEVNFNPKGTARNFASQGPQSDIVLAKYNTAGTLEWAFKLGNAGTDAVTSIHLDGAGSVFITGFFQGSVQFDPNSNAPNTLLFSNGGRDGFIAKYAESNGAIISVLSLGDTGNDEVTDLHTDAAFNTYVVGTFEGIVNFDPAGLSTGIQTSFTSLGDRDYFVIKYNLLNVPQWIFPLGSTEDDPGPRGGIGIRVTPNGNVAVAGTYRLAANFDPIFNQPDFTLVSLGEEDIFTALYTPDGNIIWCRGTGTPFSDFVSPGAVTADLANRVMVAGSVGGDNEAILAYTGTDNQSAPRPRTISGGDAFVGQYDIDGTLIWGNITGGNQNEFATTLATDNGGNVFVSGSFQGTFDFDADPGTQALAVSSASGSNYDMFFGQYDESGNLNWNFTIGAGTGENTNYDWWVAPNGTGSVITGGFFLSSTFDGITGNSRQLSSAGSSDIYVAEYDPDGRLRTQSGGNCPVPTNVRVSEITSVQALVNFDVPNIGPDDFTIRYRKVGTIPFEPLEGILTGPELITGLTPDTDYEVCVLSVCAGTPSDCSGLVRFRTLPNAVCTVPTVSLATRTSVSAVINWTPVLSVARAEYRRVGFPNWIRSAQLSNASTFTFQGLTGSTNYEYRVINYCGTDSAVSAVDQFSTLAGGGGNCDKTAVPVLTVNNILFTAANLSWTDINPGFEVNYRLKGASDWTVSVDNGTSLSLTGLTPNTEYEARVRTIGVGCAANLFPFSQIVSFRTLKDDSCRKPAFFIRNVKYRSADVFWTDTSLKKYDLSYKAAEPSGDWITFANFTFTSPVEISPLMPGKTYLVRMRRVCPGGVVSDYGDTIRFSTFPLPCADPVLRIETVDHRAITVKWSPASAGAELQYRLPSQVEWTNVTVGAADRFTVTGLLPAVTYEFRVRNLCGNFVSEYSAPVRTITKPFEPCPVPQLKVTPLDGISALLEWTPNVPMYEVQFRPEGETEWNELADVINPPFILTPLEKRTKYEIRMRSVCNGDQFSEYTPVQEFITKSDGNCDVPLITDFTQTPTSITLNWSPAGENFEIEYRPIEGTNWLKTQGSGLPPFTLTGLQPNRTYFVKVRNLCTGEASDFSDAIQITTPPVPNSCPQPVVSVSEQELTTAEVTWTPSTRIFELTYRPVGSSKWERIIRSNPAGTTPSVILTNLMPGSEYEVRVRNYCDGFSPYSEIDTFQTLFPEPVCEVPSFTVNNIGIHALTVNVNPVAANLEIQIKSRTETKWTTFYTQNQPSYRIENLLMNTEYEVRVRRFCGEIFSDFAPSVKVSTLTPPPVTCAPPQIFINANTVTDTRAGIGWRNGTLTVEISYKTIEDTVWTTFLTTLRSPFTITGLTACKNYTVRMRNRCSGEFSDYATFAFNTGCPPPPDCITPEITLGNVTDKSITISWGEQMVDAYEYSWRVKGRNTWSSNMDRRPGSITINNLLPGTEYEIRFRQYCNPEFSLFSPIQTVKTLTRPVTCAVPNDVTVANITHRSAFVTWKAPAGAVSYRLFYKITGNVGVITSLTNDPFLFLAQLRPGTNYEFQVRAVCRDGSESALSELRSFKTNASRDGFEHSDESASVQLYPNPNKGSFTVQSPEPIERLHIVDMSGKIIYSLTEVSSETTVNVPNISTGVYQLQLITKAGNRLSNRLIID